MNQQSSLLEAEPRELATVVLAMRRHLRLSFAIVVGCLALAALLSLLLPKSYTADATLAYDPQNPLTKGGGGLVMTDAQRDAAIDAQLAEVTTLAVAEDVARAVDLAVNPELRQEASNLAASSERKLSRDEALGTALLDHVKARRVGQTPMFTIGFSAGSASQAALIANGFAASYLKAAVQHKAALADGSAGQLGTRVAALRQQANAAEGQLAAFRLANNLLDTPDSTALDQEVAALRGQLAEARGQAALAGTRSAAVSGLAVVGGGSGGSVDTTAVSALTQQRAATAAELAALLGRYGEKYPDVIAAREKLAELDVQWAGAMHGNRNSAAVETYAAVARARALAASLKDAETHLAANVSHDARLLDLRNSALAVRLAYQDALKLSADQAAQRALIQPDVQIIAPAVPPLRPKFSRLGISLLVGLALGLGAAVGVAFMRATWRHTLGSVDDIARWLQTDYFAPLPRLAAAMPILAAAMPSAGSRDPIAAILLHPKSVFAESFRSLGTAALFAARQSDTPGGRVIGIASALPGEGKTTASIAMGRLLASDGMKVALVDGDPRGGPGIRALAGSALAGGAALNAGPKIDRSGLALFASDIDRDELQPSQNPDELARMIAALRRDYDVVIVDTAPILPGGDARHLLAGLDALVLLARWRTTPVSAIREAMRRIAAAGGHVSGVALSMTA